MKAEEIIKHISQYLIKEVGCGLSELIESYDTTFVEEHILDAVQSLLQQREEAEREAFEAGFIKATEKSNKLTIVLGIEKAFQDYKAKQK